MNPFESVLRESECLKPAMSALVKSTVTAVMEHAEVVLVRAPMSAAAKRLPFAAQLAFRIALALQCVQQQQGLHALSVQVLDAADAVRAAVIGWSGAALRQRPQPPAHRGSRMRGLAASVMRASGQRSSLHELAASGASSVGAPGTVPLLSPTSFLAKWSRPYHC